MYSMHRRHPMVIIRCYCHRKFFLTIQIYIQLTTNGRVILNNSLLHLQPKGSFTRSGEFPMVHILNYTYPIHILKYYSQTIILIVFSRLHLVFPKCILPKSIQKIKRYFSNLSCPCYPNNIWLNSVNYLNSNIYFLPPRSRYSPQHPLVTHLLSVRPEVLIAMNVSATVFWDVTPCGLVDKHQHSEGSSCLHLQDKNIS